MSLSRQSPSADQPQPNASVKLSARDLKAMGQVFEAEVYGRLPFQSKSESFPRLERAGLVRKHVVAANQRSFASFTIKGWALTELGRLRYCESCPPNGDKV